MSISRIIEDLRGNYLRYRKEAIFAMIIFLTAFISFGAGYLANRELNHAPIIIEQCALTDRNL